MKPWQLVMKLPGMQMLNPEMHETDTAFCVLAEFDDPGKLLDACEEVRDAGFSKWDCYTPFPVHGIEDAMGQKASILPWFVAGGSLAGGIGGFGLQWFTSVIAYPMVISGKPFFSWQAFVPVTFELAVLGGALSAVFGMFMLCRLPNLSHPLFSSQRFERMSDDRFFLAIEASDPDYRGSETQVMLEGLGAVNVELVEVNE